MNLSGWIRTTRNNMGLTQSELAVRAKVGLATLQNIEADSANPEMETVKRILAELGLEVSISKKPIDWSLWSALGVPLLPPQPSTFIRADQSLLVAQLSSLAALLATTISQSREQTSIASFLCALQDHYPNIYFLIKPKVRRQIRPFLERQVSPKLRRLALAKLQEYL